MCPKAAAQGANPAGRRPDLHYSEPELGTPPRSSPADSLGRSGSAFVIWFQILPSGSALSGEAKITFLWLFSHSLQPQQAAFSGKKKGEKTREKEEEGKRIRG